MRFALAALLLSLAAMPALAAEPPVGLDHLIIYAKPGAPEQAALKEAGFTINPIVNRHAGQGTASVTVEFANGFLELIYVDPAVSVTPAMVPIVQKFRDRANWRESGASPLAVQVHRNASAPAEFPFATFKVHNEWMGPGNNIEILTPREMPNAITLSVPPYPVDEAENAKLMADPVKGAAFRHANGTHRLTGVKIVAPDAAALPPAAKYLADAGAAEFVTGNEWLMIVTLDNARQGKVVDLHPDLPLIVHY